MHVATLQELAKRTYMTKAMPDGQVEVYRRDYSLLASLTAATAVEFELVMHRLQRVERNRWPNYRGGQTTVPGMARWWVHEVDLPRGTARHPFVMSTASAG